MKYFVTGATGFIGSHLCHALVQDGHEIVALLRSQAKRNKLPMDHVEVLEGDLRYFCKKGVQIPRVDGFIHLAFDKDLESGKEAEKDSVACIRNIVNCLKRQSWKPEVFLFASSLAAAGPVNYGHPVRETDSLHPMDKYGKAKKAMEDHLLRHAPFPVTIFRPPTVFGPERGVQRLFVMAERGVGFTVGKTKQQMSYLFIDDLIHALKLLIYQPADHHEVYYLAAEEIVDLEVFWKQMEPVVKKKVRVLVLPKAFLAGLSRFLTGLHKLHLLPNIFPLHTYEKLVCGSFICSSDKFAKRYNWQPQYDLPKTLQETYARAQVLGWNN